MTITDSHEYMSLEKVTQKKIELISQNRKLIYNHNEMTASHVNTISINQ